MKRWKASEEWTLLKNKLSGLVTEEEENRPAGQTDQTEEQLLFGGLTDLESQHTGKKIKVVFLLSMTPKLTFRNTLDAISGENLE